MNDKDFEELAQGLFGLDTETLQATLAEDENREFAFKVAKRALECGGFKNTLIVAEDVENFGVSMPGNSWVAAILIVTALKHAPKGTLENVLSHFGKVGGEQ